VASRVRRARRSPADRQWQLEPGDRLPTVRRLAEHLSINLHTVRSAYQKLEVQGLVETRRGRGMHVLSFDPRLVAQAAGPLRSHMVGVIVAGWGNPFYHTLRSMTWLRGRPQTNRYGRASPDGQKQVVRARAIS
jgi:DNA-binding transcriptional MocR family regulator